MDTGLVSSIQDIMRKDSGVDGDAQRISQLGWMIFLKVFDDKEEEWELQGKYKSPIPEKLRWRNWAKNEEGITGEDLLKFVNNELFPTLKELEVKKGEIKTQLVKDVFTDTHNYMKSGTLLRQVINILNGIDFNSTKDRHLFNDLYEKILKDLQSAGNAGEFYTPRPVTQFIVDMIDPKIGDKILDPACGTGGFLTCVINNLKKKAKTKQDLEKIQNNLLGVEKKQLPHLLCTTNLILHDVEVPNIKRGNTLERPLRDYSDTDMVDIVVTNPPFGGDEENGIELNFPATFRTRETADLFLVLIMKILNEQGKCGIILPDGGLLSGMGVKKNIREKLLSEFNLHTIIRLPNGVFSPYTGIKTNILFFEKGKPTKEIWYFEHPLPKGCKTYNKGKPIQYSEFNLEKEWWKNRENNKFKPYCWKVNKEQLGNDLILDIKNPLKKISTNSKSSKEIIENLFVSFKENIDLLEQIKGEL